MEITQDLPDTHTNTQQQQAAPQRPPPPPLLTPGQRLKRTLQEYEQSILQQQTATPQELSLADPQEQPASQDGPTPPSSKQVKLTTSKILGVANPRRPRVGPQFQADVPEWP